MTISAKYRHNAAVTCVLASSDLLLGPSCWRSNVHVKSVRAVQKPSALQLGTAVYYVLPRASTSYTQVQVYNSLLAQRNGTSYRTAAADPQPKTWGAPTVVTKSHRHSGGRYFLLRSEMLAGFYFFAFELVHHLETVFYGKSLTDLICNATRFAASRKGSAFG